MSRLGQQGCRCFLPQPAQPARAETVPFFVNARVQMTQACPRTQVRGRAPTRTHTHAHIYLATTHERRDLHVIVQHYERIEPEGPHTGLHTMVCTTQPFLLRSPLAPPAPPLCRFSVLPKPPIFGGSCVTFNPMSISILPSVAPHERGQRFHVLGVGRV